MTAGQKPGSHTQMYERSIAHKLWRALTQTCTSPHIYTLISVMPARPRTHYKTSTHYWHLLFLTHIYKLMHTHMLSHTYTHFSSSHAHTEALGGVFTDLHALLWPVIYTMCGQTPGSLFYWLEGDAQVHTPRLYSPFWVSEKSIQQFVTKQITRYLLNQVREDGVHCETFRDVIRC